MRELSPRLCESLAVFVEGGGNYLYSCETPLRGSRRCARPVTADAEEGFLDDEGFLYDAPDDAPCTAGSVKVLRSK